MSRDNNDGKGVVGRVAFSPMLGVEVAGSSYYGQYSNKNAAGVNNQNNNIGIYAVDWTLQRGPWELIGEAAWSRITGNQGNTNATLGPDGMFGYYIQANYHFMPDFLRKLAPSHFTEASTFTAVVRWDRWIPTLVGITALPPRPTRPYTADSRLELQANRRYGPQAQLHVEYAEKHGGHKLCQQPRQ